MALLPPPYTGRITLRSLLITPLHPGAGTPMPAYSSRHCVWCTSYDQCCRLLQTRWLIPQVVEDG